MSEPSSRVLLSAEGIAKRYGQVHALRGANFDVFSGEVVGLIGDNGAGKSTLVKVLAGALRPDAGTITLEGEHLDLHNPLDAQRLGIETVYQDLALAFDLDAAANLHLGRETVRGGPLGWFGVLDKAGMRSHAVEAFHNLGITLPDLSVPVRSLSGGQRQSVAVARAVAWATKVVFMDEPTAALGVVQRGQVLDVVRRVRDQGVGVVGIHVAVQRRADEIFRGAAGQAQNLRRDVGEDSIRIGRPVHILRALRERP